MLPFLAAAAPIIGAGMQMWGQQQANETNASNVQRTNAFNASEAEKNRDFQAQMSNTAHRREIDDLKSAGLNPLLSATGGAGASSPSGATASGETAKAENTLENLSSALTTSALAKQRFEQGEADLSLTRAQKRKTETEERVARVGIPRAEIVNDFYSSTKGWINKQLGEAVGHTSAKDPRQRDTEKAELQRQEKRLEEIRKRKNKNKNDLTIRLD